MFYRLHPSPLGELLLAGNEQGLQALQMDAQPPADGEPAGARFDEVCRQLDEYFAARRRVFDLPLAPRGTLFQQQVWQGLQAIPYGQTCSYGELAQRIGNPGGMRAVGMANNANPIAIIIPCHRVIGSDGSLTGYASGIERKHQLLVLEGAWLL